MKKVLVGKYSDGKPYYEERASRAEFLKRAAELNIIIEDNGDCLTIDAPKGFVFAGYGTHYEAIFWQDGWTKPTAYAELISCMRMGVEKCEDKECETCNSITA